MKTDRRKARCIKYSLGHNYRDEGQDREVGLERLELLERTRVAKRRWLTKRQAQALRFDFQRIRPSGRRIGRREHVHDLLAALMQRRQRLLCKCGLSDQNDTQDPPPPMTTLNANKSLCLLPRARFALPR